jgi:hypothetical protein
MKIARRYQSQLLYRRSYKPDRVIRIRPTAKVNIVFRPVNRFGMKPQLTSEDQKSLFGAPEAVVNTDASNYRQNNGV